MAKLVLFVLPLGLDTFAVAAALGIAGLPARQRLKISLLMTGFEVAMPVVGVLVGRGLGSTIGSAADYLAVAVLVVLAGYMLASGDGGEGEKVAALVGNRGLPLIALGLSISLDELAMGFSIGLLHLSLPIAVVLIGAQAFVMAQIGLRLGSRLGETIREGAEALAAVALVGLAGLILAEKLIS